MRPRHIVLVGSSESGVSLLVTLMILSALAMGGALAVSFTDSNTRSSRSSSDRRVASGKADAGIGMALSVLNRQDATGRYVHDVLDPTLLPVETGSLPGVTGSYKYWGTLDLSADPAVWLLASEGTTPNPTGPSVADLREQASVEVPVIIPKPGLVEWKYIYGTDTGNPCDFTIGNSTDWRAALYVGGNLCLENSATFSYGPIVVEGQVSFGAKSSSIGTSGQPIDSVHVGGGCQPKSGPFHAPCLNGATPGGDNIFVTGLAAGAPVPSTPPLTPIPEVDFDKWYANASIGPNSPCRTSSGPPPNGTGSWTTAFDNDTLRNRSNPTFDLTPNWSYSCTTYTGHISYDAPTKRLTIDGGIYIDGDVIADEKTGVVRYDGQGALVISGSFQLRGTGICADDTGGSGGCNYSLGGGLPHWNASTEMLLIAADGTGGPALKSDVGIFLRGTEFQGALYATGQIEFDTTTEIQAAMVGKPVLSGNSVIVHRFPPEPMIVPNGAPIASGPFPDTPRNFAD